MMLNDNDQTVSVVQDLLFKEIKFYLENNRNQSQKSLLYQQSSPYMNINCQNYLLKEYQMIAQQNQFLEQIKQQITKKKKTTHSEIIFYGSNSVSDILPIESSFDLSNISHVLPYDDEPFKTKFGEEFQRSFQASALQEIQSSCSSETYEAVRACLLNNKLKELQAMSQKYEKLVKKYEQLQASYIIKSSHLSQIEAQLNDALLKIEQFEQEKKKLRIKSNQLIEKERRVYKLQSAIVFKQKLLNQGKKRYERQKNFFLSVDQRLKKIYQKLEQIWEQILEKMEKSQDVSCLIPCQVDGETGNCWKRQVMRKCKQQLIEQRNLLRQEEEHLQKEFEFIQMLSDQAKKIINQKQTNIDSFKVEQSSFLL